jgi:hypothetical protein
MAMTALDELRITIDDAIEVARKIATESGSRQVALVIMKLEEALLLAERIDSLEREARE